MRALHCAEPRLKDERRPIYGSSQKMAPVPIGPPIEGVSHAAISGCEHRGFIPEEAGRGRRTALDAARVECEVAVEWPSFAPHAFSLLSHLLLILAQGRERRPTLFGIAYSLP
jgi:hypothetical protein